MSIATAVKVARHLATGNFGYGQDDRKSAWNDNGKLGLDGLREPGDSDCSFATALAQALGSLIPMDVLRHTLYSGNYGAAVGGTGMADRINVRGLSLAQINAKARPADAIVGPGHVMFHLGGGLWMSFEHTEKGGSTGGKLGRQKGEGIFIRKLYTRGSSSRRKAKSKTGWAEIVRPKSPSALLGALLALYGKGKSVTAAQKRVNIRSSWDGPRYAEFLAEWDVLNEGVPITYDAATLPVPQTGHAYIVLGGTTSQMGKRVDAALPGILANPNSKVIVTGGKLRDGVTEAEWMEQRLLDAGVSPSRIVLEKRAQSTIGNALYSVEIMERLGLTSYTLASFESHLRRAAILFRAALAKLETADNRRRGITATTSVAFDDYGTRVHNSTLPVDPSTRAQYAGYVAALLGVSAQYQAAL